ncbi:hypothetical protein [Fodinicola feengrottensis]|uniref:SH3 domain-containing protein n=1 Tax=Fodinicola feengrottensis TaxID=435914 RepID=A0ABN2I7U7_9ACTN|nr:hypothetical protein [Fodinicola feengrottensis]
MRVKAILVAGIAAVALTGLAAPATASVRTAAQQPSDGWAADFLSQTDIYGGVPYDSAKVGVGTPGDQVRVTCHTKAGWLSITDTTTAVSGFVDPRYLKVYGFPFECP